MNFRNVVQDEERKSALYRLGSMTLKGFVSEHHTKGLYWFNTEEGINTNKRDLLVSATDLKVLV